MVALSVEQKLKIRAAANDWISRNLPDERRHIVHSAPEFSQPKKAWVITLATKGGNGDMNPVGRLVIDDNARVVEAQDPARITEYFMPMVLPDAEEVYLGGGLQGEGFEFRLDDGIEGAKALPDRSVDLLLTDPPYGISNPYICEGQVPRRLRKNGNDFIMPRGYFGDWDELIKSHEWLDVVLPKVAGWAVVFCAQAQIGEYTEFLKAHKFSAVGTLVWQKTNPVPFNHNYKPINAWEALVVGKRPGTKFNGHVVHNVFLHKSPSPQQRIHPTQKPLPLLEEFVRLFSNEGGLVFDPFAGSATTLIAAHRLGRQCLAYEKEPAIYEVACKRILKEVGHGRL